MNKYILLWLEAPLQSWGHDSIFDKRESLDFPTKSGILGLICCSSGKRGEQIEWLEKWQHTSMSVIAFSKQNKNIKRTPMLEDFHMVGAGYNDKDKWQSMMSLKKSDGKKPVGEGTKLTYRYYIQDMAYGVVLEVPEDIHSEVVYHLQNPIWDVYLGRKNCIPSEIIYQGCFETIEMAVNKIIELSTIKDLKALFETTDITPNDEKRDEYQERELNDMPIRFGDNKRYKSRLVFIKDC